MFTIDFVLHAQGLASGSASAARGSLLATENVDCPLLAGDETGLPAIGRRLEELPIAGI